MGQAAHGAAGGEPVWDALVTLMYGVRGQARGVVAPILACNGCLFIVHLYPRVLYSVTDIRVNWATRHVGNNEFCERCVRL